MHRIHALLSQAGRVFGSMMFKAKPFKQNLLLLGT